MTKILYLASPYWHPEPIVRGRRARAVSRLAARFMEFGFPTFSPIAHGISIYGFVAEPLRNDHKFWLAQDFAMLQHASLFVVHTLQDWQFSYGVGKEIEEANRLSIPIEYCAGDEHVEAFVGKYPNLCDAATAGIRPREVAGISGFDR